MPTPTLNLEAVRDRMVLRGIDGNADLGRRMGVDRTVVSRVLGGQRPARPSFLVALAAALDVPLASIIAPDPATVAAITDEVAS